MPDIPKLYEVFQQSNRRWYFIKPIFSLEDSVITTLEDCLVGPFNTKEDAEDQVRKIRHH